MSGEEGKDEMQAARELETDAAAGTDDLRTLFHRLNNQLGIVLANAELLEARAPDESTRARAALVVESALEAMGTVRALRCRLDQLTGEERDRLR